jgi:hypothetical protein
VEAIDTRGGKAGSAVTDAAGAYTIPLAPGGYTLHVVTNGQFPRCPDSSVTVTSGAPVTADIHCDTGIR